jgi:hypothetical protein
MRAMAAHAHLEVLQLIAHRSPEGCGVPVSTIEEEGVDGEALESLEADGLITHCDDETIVITESGWRALEQLGSA